jgi:tRNA(Ile)-lysidine synthase
MSDDQLPSNRATGAFERRLARTLATLVPADAPLIVACSGGADSTAALVATSRARGNRGSPVIAAHFDHGLRGSEEATLDRLAVETVAAKLDRPVESGAASEGAPVKHSEATAREHRYRWLGDVCADVGVSYCVTGHTLDDQAETVLLRLTRGTGVSGASAMDTLSPWPVACERDSLSLVRPLLEARRSETREYVTALGLEARDDPTNDSLVFDRNRVRHRVMPELRELNPNVDQALSRFADLARRDDEALEQWAEQEAGQLLRVGAGVAALDRRRLLDLPVALASRLLRRAAGRVRLSLDASQVEALLQIAGRRGARVSLTGGEGVVADEELQIRRRLRKKS